MQEMKLVVAGAAGRMGKALIRAVTEMPGATVCAALEREGSAALGQDAGEMAGAGRLGVAVTADPLAAIAKADGILDFTGPAATVSFAGYAAQARIAHVIGTTGCSDEDNAKIEAAARHAAIVKSGNMSLGVNLL
ncbi:MAG: 4-hydroxy-tetrahydrodipicolinate reductase, partial [Notoacmeibacter sp.]|nr:4-hydroxy-tetrahydrodipicolinate reductase [Notoacmeibacter sp.]